MKVEKRKINEEFEKKYFVGLEAYQVVCVNPTKKELNKLYEKEDEEGDEEINYVVDKDGDDQVRIVIYLKGLTTDRIRSVRFFVTDTERKNKEGTKNQWINQTCSTTWCDEEENLPEWFTSFRDKDKKVIGKQKYRKALQGEGDFYEFLRNIMNGVNFFSEDTDIHFEFKKMLKGNFSQLNQYLCDVELVGSFGLLNYIKNDVENEKTYNELFTKAVLPTGTMNRLFTLQEPYYKDALAELIADKDFKADEVKDFLTVYDIFGYVNSPKVTFKKDYDNKPYEKFMKAVEDEYGCKGFYKIAPIFEYHEDMCIASGNSPVAVAVDDGSY